VVIRAAPLPAVAARRSLRGSLGGLRIRARVHSPALCAYRRQLSSVDRFRNVTQGAHQAMGCIKKHLRKLSEPGVMAATEPKRRVKPSLLSRVTFSYMDPLLRLGAERPLKPDDLPPVWHTYDAETQFGDFQKAWKVTLPATPCRRPRRLRSWGVHAGRHPANASPRRLARACKARRASAVFT
jgi:hypothetical protein